MILVSLGLIGQSNIHTALAYNLEILCKDRKLEVTEVMKDLASVSSWDDINDKLGEYFPGTIKLVQ